jgi:putative ABC transport system permease protein
VSLMLPQSRYPTGVAQSELYRRILEALANRPEIRAAGVGFPGPLRGSSATGSFLIEGRPDVPEQRPFANLGAVSGDYFAAMGIPLVAGRTFADSDEADAPEVAIANAALARKYWPGEDAVGKQLRFGDGPGPPWRTIVGVVGDVRQLGLGEAAPPILYIPYQQFPLPFTEIVIRSEAPTSAVVSLVQTRLREIDPELPTGEFFTLTDVLGRSVAEPRFRAVLMSVFAALALVLSAVGVFGLVSYSVTQRTREVGIRMVLGANPYRVLLEMMREGIALTLVGIGLGLAGAVASARVIGTFLTGVAPTDRMTLTVVVLFLLAVAGIATYLPSRRALRVEPTAALRAD